MHADQPASEPYAKSLRRKRFAAILLSPLAVFLTMFGVQTVLQRGQDHSALQIRGDVVTSQYPTQVDADFDLPDIKKLVRKDIDTTKFYAELEEELKRRRLTKARMRSRPRVPRRTRGIGRFLKAIF